MRLRRLVAATSQLAFLVAFASTPLAAADFSNDLTTLAAANSDFAGQLDAQRAWKRVVGGNAEDIPQVLSAMREAGPIGMNWLGLAADAIADRAVQQGQELPADALEAFLQDRSQAPRARRVAYEMLTTLDPKTPQRWLPRLLDDPSLELRYDAVQEVIEAADAMDDPQKKAEQYQRALNAARNLEQIKRCAAALEGLEQPVNLREHLGFLSEWSIIGPFDNTELAGFDTEYPPERGVDLDASYTGTSGAVSWATYRSTEEYGIVDLNAAVGDLKESVAYAAVRFQSDSEQQAQIRLGSQNASKIWLNGKQLGAHEVYHSGGDIDQYVMPATLRGGENTILVKICQNSKSMPWEKNWQFQLRVTDELGAAANIERP